MIPEQAEGAHDAHGKASSRLAAQATLGQACDGSVDESKASLHPTEVRNRSASPTASYCSSRTRLRREYRRNYNLERRTRRGTLENRNGRLHSRHRRRPTRDRRRERALYWNRVAFLRKSHAVRHRIAKQYCLEFAQDLAAERIAVRDFASPAERSAARSHALPVGDGALPAESSAARDTSPVKDRALPAENRTARDTASPTQDVAAQRGAGAAPKVDLATRLAVAAQREAGSAPKANLATRLAAAARCEAGAAPKTNLATRLAAAFGLDARAAPVDDTHGRRDEVEDAAGTAGKKTVEPLEAEAQDERRDLWSLLRVLGSWFGCCHRRGKRED